MEDIWLRIGKSNEVLMALVVTLAVLFVAMVTLTGLVPDWLMGLLLGLTTVVLMVLSVIAIARGWRF